MVGLNKLSTALVNYGKKVATRNCASIPRAIRGEMRGEMCTIWGLRNGGGELKPFVTNHILPQLKKFSKEEQHDLLAILKRKPENQHDLERLIGLKNIHGEALSSKELAYCLEFRHFAELQNVRLENLDKLTVEQKQHFLEGLISVVHSGDESLFNIKNILNIFEDLKSAEDYNALLKKLIKELPECPKVGFETVSPALKEKFYKAAIPVPQTSLEQFETSLATADGITNRMIKLDPKAPKFYGIIHAVSDFMPEQRLLGLKALEKSNPNHVLSGSIVKPGRYHTFHGNKNGVILETDSTKVIAMANRDLDSGAGNRTLGEVLREYLFIARRKQDRNYIPDLIKGKLHCTEDEYVRRMKKVINKNCGTIEEIEAVDSELASALKEVIDNNRVFETLVHNPRIKAVFTKHQEYNNIPREVREFASEHNLPIVVLP